METELKILVLEDNIYDAGLIEQHLRHAGLACRLTRVETQEAFLEALQEGPPDVILSDHGLPAFNGFEALAAAKQKCPEVPFIFVTGLMGQEKEIETMERSAIDYVLKSQLSRLALVVKRAAHQAQERIRLREQELALRETEERFRVLVEGVKDYAICMLDSDERVSSWNTGAQWITGYEEAEIIAQPFSCFYPAAAIAAGLPARALAQARANGRLEAEHMLLRKGGPPFRAHLTLTALRDQQRQLRGFALVIRDITAPKQAEAERERLIQELQTALYDLKILSGLLPICASCKKVRDHRGEWHPLEVYLREHSEVILTHEFCRDCAPHIQLTKEVL